MALGDFFWFPRQLFLHLSSWWCSLLLVLEATSIWVTRWAEVLWVFCYDVFWGLRSCGCQIFVTGGWDAAAWLSQCHSTVFLGKTVEWCFFPKQMAIQKEEPWGPAGWRVLLQVHVFQVHGSKKYTESCYSLENLFCGPRIFEGQRTSFFWNMVACFSQENWWFVDWRFRI